MDSTSSYRAATIVEQQGEASIENIYANATSLQGSSSGLSDEFMDTTQGLGGGVGNRVNNIYIFLMSGSTLTIPRSAIFANFNIAGGDDDWSVSIPIDDLAYSGGTIAYNNETALNVGTGGSSGDDAQTIARIPIVRDKLMLNALGVYKEGLICKNGEAIVEYYKI